ncbi:hypothetical protein CD30_18640 [Ureibacillus massiliensis 4400831 = CIP 108448 = CCUG 49529]|uniref:Fluoride-specific ion channel FluC n=1 Tax=Ureibacillus massiliensis 4400831 = CIP 108448 = CCUG 49529 TaxID=1211035 RepID=A0A0A3IST8_9BACL|nr:hypothetical protein CD30_18640 [Ureibacillus massiliensis 4400831 = CIP 108448 = CCUG 49529]
MLVNILQVFLGGMVGAALRFSIQTFFSTFIMLWIANVLGSFLLGCLNGYYEKLSTEKMKLFFTTGMLGAFTTFSTFSQQWFELIQESYVIGIVYGLTMTLICCFVALLGYRIFRGEQ